MRDLFDMLLSKDNPIGRYRNRAHGYFTFPKLEGELGSQMSFNRKKVIMWSLNDYLGLANHQEVRQIDADSTAKFGLAYPMGSRMMSGNTEFHEQLEHNLSEFVNKEDTLLLNFGYQGMVSIIDSLCSRHDIIIYDAESHACIIDGLRLHTGHRFVFKHNDIIDLEKQLDRAKKLLKNRQNGGVLVITEGVFGMAGDQGKLREIVKLKEKYPFRLLVDDAHGFGTLGVNGAGTGEEQGVQQDIDLYFSTFVKSMASLGAFVSGDKIIIDFIRYTLRSQIFAKSLPLTFVIGNIKRLELIKSNPKLKDKLWENAITLQNGLRERGFDIGVTNSVITPVYMKGGIAEATAMLKDLRESYGIFCSVVVYPVIPKDTIIYRLIPTANHSTTDILNTLNAFTKVKVKLDTGQYKQTDIPNMVEMA